MPEENDPLANENKCFNEKCSKTKNLIKLSECEHKYCYGCLKMMSLGIDVKEEEKKKHQIIENDMEESDESEDKEE